METAPMTGVVCGIVAGAIMGIMAGAIMGIMGVMGVMGGRMMGLIGPIRPGGAAVNTDDEDNTTQTTGNRMSHRERRKDMIDASLQAKEGRPQGEGTGDWDPWGGSWYRGTL
jgi:hypothetical protein